MSALLKNQSIKFSSDAVMKLTRGGGKKAVVFPPKRSKDLSTGCGVRRAGSSQKKDSAPRGSRGEVLGCQNATFPV